MRLLTSICIMVLVATLAPQPTSAAEAIGAFAGSEVCTDCHDDVFGEHRDVHQRIASFEVQGREVGCESCHGAGARHAEEGDPDLIRAMKAEDPATDQACLSCHLTKKLAGWRASVHSGEGLSCLDCHAVHEASVPTDNCVTCHTEQVTEFRLPSHHPIPEGKMDCASCHDPHAATPSQLKTAMRQSDLCFECHQAIEGPFMFEHAPVQEDCAICHRPHGAVANNLLVANEPMLCLQCHEFHFHAGYQSADSHEVDVGGFARENPFGAQGFNMAYTTSCTQCHSHIHGSDTPTQTVTGRGGALLH